MRKERRRGRRGEREEERESRWRREVERGAGVREDVKGAGREEGGGKRVTKEIDGEIAGGSRREEEWSGQRGGKEA